MVEFLRANRGPRTVHDIYNYVRIGRYQPNLASNPQLRENLISNTRVIFNQQGQTFEFKVRILARAQDIRFKGEDIRGRPYTILCFA